MNKITAEHLARRACVYIRQSTPDQVKYNLESKRRQYGLADRARALGWVDIDVIDDDLGISGRQRLQQIGKLRACGSSSTTEQSQYRGRFSKPLCSS